MQARITKWQNQTDILLAMRAGLEKEKSEYQLLNKQKTVALQSCRQYQDEIRNLIEDFDNYIFGSRLLNLRISYFGDEVKGVTRLKPRIREEVLQLHALNEKCKQDIEQQFSVQASKVTVFLEQAKAQFNSNGYYWSWEHQKAIGLIEKKIADLKEKISVDLPILQSRKEQKLAKEQKTRAIVAAFYGKTREEAARLKSQLKITESCPYCNSPLKDDCQADHIFPVTKRRTV